MNAIQREHENLSRIVISLGSRATQLQQEIESLARKREETEAAVERSRGQLDESLTKLHELSEVRIGLEAEVADLAGARARSWKRARWHRASCGTRPRIRCSNRSGAAIARKSAFDLLREQIALDLHAGIDALADVEPPADDEGARGAGSRGGEAVAIRSRRSGR